jgi:hypothetical protein
MCSLLHSSIHFSAINLLVIFISIVSSLLNAFFSITAISFSSMVSFSSSSISSSEVPSSHCSQFARITCSSSVGILFITHHSIAHNSFSSSITSVISTTSSITSSQSFTSDASDASNSFTSTQLFIDFISA